MDVTSAYGVWGVGMALAVIVWLLGLRSFGRTFGADAVRPVSGDVSVPDVSTADALGTLARSLAAGHLGIHARVGKVSDRFLEALLRPTTAPTGDGGWPATAAARLECLATGGLSGNARVRYSLDSAPLGARYARLMKVTLMLGLIAIAAAAFVFPSFVIPCEIPAVRWQVVQVVQLSHFLWPPFLLAYLGRRARHIVQERSLDLLHNLPHLVTEAPRLGQDRPKP